MTQPLLGQRESAWPAPHTRTPVTASVRLPGSKSLTARHLILAALADGPGKVAAALRSRDTELMATALNALGAEVTTEDENWQVTPGELRPASIDCGLAGTVMRFVPPVAALAPGPVSFDGDEHARTRPMSAILSGLEGLGVAIDHEGFLPFAVHGSGSVAGGTVELDASASSQFVSALLLAGARYREGITVINTGASVPSAPHIEMTLACLRERGVQVEVKPNCWRVHPGPIRAMDVVVEPDLSTAAPFLGLALSTGGEITVEGWPQQTTQAGDALRDFLAQMGAEVTHTGSALRVKGTGRIGGVELDLHDHGELTPALAALCALADSPSRLFGIGHIRGHETDRLRALSTQLRRLGSDVNEESDALVIRPAQLHAPSEDGIFKTYADHRMAHAAVILGAAIAGIKVENIATTSKTFPGFETVWKGLFG